MQPTHVVTSAQVAIGATQALVRSPGQLVVPPQPIVESAGSSPVPQVLSAPPHASAIELTSFACAVASDALAVGSLSQLVPAGSVPRSTLSSQTRRTFVRVWAYFDAALPIALGQGV